MQQDTQRDLEAVTETTDLLDAMAWGHDLRAQIVERDGTMALDQISALFRDHALSRGVDLSDATFAAGALVVLQLIVERCQAYGLDKSVDFACLVAEMAGVLVETGGL